MKYGPGQRVVVIDATRGRPPFELRELLRYRDLLLVMAYRDYRIRYAQTALGVTWAFIQPAAILAILVIVFGKAVRVDTGPVPYPLFAACGLAAWSYFSYVLAQAGMSIIGAQEMIKKTYFPRLIIPLSKAIVGFVDFGITILLLVGLMLMYGWAPSANVVFAVPFAAMGVAAGLGAGIWVSALTIRYRDVQHVVPFLVQLGLYVTPVAYPAALVSGSIPGWATAAYYFNPMAGVIEGFRWSVLGTAPPPPVSYLSFAVIVVLLGSGIWYFSRVEATMADVV